MEISKYLCIKFTCLVIVMVLCFMTSDCAEAQPIYHREEEDIRLFAIRALSGNLEFRFEYEDNREKGGGILFERTEARFEERLGLKTRGSVYHPNLLEFSLDTSLGLRQQIFSGDLDGQEHTFPYEYQIHLNFLREKPYGFNLFALRSSNPIGRTFFETIDMESDSYGGTFRYQNKIFPMTLLLLNQSTKEDSLEYKRNRTERTVDFRVSNKLKDILESDFRYIYKDLIEETPSRHEITSHDLSFNNRLGDGNFRGISNVSYLKTLGDFKTDQLRVVENFQMDHSKSLTSLYHYSFFHFSTVDFRSNLNQGYIGFRHKLYESLVTEVRGEVSLTDATEFEELFYGSNLSFSYRKKVPGGVLSAGYNLLYRRTDREAEEGVVKIFGERIVLSDSQRTFLANPNVILGSIVVRDSLGVLLTLNVDYRLISVGNLTEIQRVALLDNTPVLVDYEFSFPRSLKYDTLTHGVNLRYDFGRLISLYYNYFNSRQKDISNRHGSGPSSALYDTNRSLYGAELKWRWFQVAGEYEDDRSELNPFTTIRIRGHFSISPFDHSSLNLSATCSQTEYEKDRRSMITNRADGLFHLRLNSFLEALLGVGYLREKGRDMDTRAWKWKGELISKFRSIELKLQSEYLRRREISQDRDEMIIKLYLIRHFHIH